MQEPVSDEAVGRLRARAEAAGLTLPEERLRDLAQRRPSLDEPITLDDVTAGVGLDGAPPSAGLRLRDGRGDAHSTPAVGARDLPAPPDGRPLHELSIREAGALIRSGRTSAVALLDAVLVRAAATEPALHAYITVGEELARRQATDADAALERGEDSGPLHGIPIAVKDLIDVAGLPTTGGAEFLRDNVPSKDAAVTERLREAGAVMVGKLNLHEFGMGATSTSSHVGAVANPWDLTRVAGGSSGGSAAAVAAGSAYATLGTDTGGSIRIPASLCGVVGLKPTYGRVSRRGVIPLSWSLDHVGPLARTVEDAALMLNAIAGFDPEDTGSADEPIADAAALLGRGDLRGVRVGIVDDPFWRRMDDDVREACERTLDALRSRGAAIVDVDMPLLARVRRRKGGRFYLLEAESAAAHAEWYERFADRYTPAVRAGIEAGHLLPATAYVNDLRLRGRVIAEARDVMATVDVVAAPTIERTAPTLEEGDPRGRLVRLTAPFNLNGLPSITVPCGLDRRGLPIGFMVSGRHFDEAMTCAVAQAVEQDSGWDGRLPRV